MSSSFEVFSITTLSLGLIVVIVAILATYVYSYVRMCVYTVQRIEDDTDITHDTMKQIIYIEQLILFF